MPGQPKNLNGLVDGSRVTGPIPLSRAPRRYQRQFARVRKLAHGLRAMVVERFEECDLYRESLVMEAAQWELHRQLVMARLQRDAEVITADTFAMLSEKAARASTERSKTLRLLGLNDSPDEWDKFGNHLRREAYERALAEDIPLPSGEPTAVCVPGSEVAVAPVSADASAGIVESDALP